MDLLVFRATPLGVTFGSITECELLWREFLCEVVDRPYWPLKSFQSIGTSEIFIKLTPGWARVRLGIYTWIKCGYVLRNHSFSSLLELSLLSRISISVRLSDLTFHFSSAERCLSWPFISTFNWEEFQLFAVNPTVLFQFPFVFFGIFRKPHVPYIIQLWFQRSLVPQSQMIFF